MCCHFFCCHPAAQRRDLLLSSQPQIPPDDPSPPACLPQTDTSPPIPAHLSPARSTPAHRQTVSHLPLKPARRLYPCVHTPGVSSVDRPTALIQQLCQRDHHRRLSRTSGGNRTPHLLLAVSIDRVLKIPAERSAILDTSHALHRAEPAATPIYVERSNSRSGIGPSQPRLPRPARSLPAAARRPADPARRHLSSLTRGFVSNADPERAVPIPSYPLRCEFHHASIILPTMSRKVFQTKSPITTGTPNCCKVQAGCASALHHAPTDKSHIRYTVHRRQVANRDRGAQSLLGLTHDQVGRPLISRTKVAGLYQSKAPSQQLLPLPRIARGAAGPALAARPISRRYSPSHALTTISSSLSSPYR